MGPATTWLYTDGSKTQDMTSFAVVNENNVTLSCGHLPQFCSVFTAEALAISEACSLAIKIKGKTIICTDSMSSIAALSNPYPVDQTIRKICCIMVRHPKITILWVPGHRGITGNETADSEARNVQSAPSHLFSPHNKKDLVNLVLSKHNTSKLTHWSNFNHRYLALNPNCTKTQLPTLATRKIATTFTRLRIGHSQQTHGHLLAGKPPPICHQCSEPCTMNHILNECLPTASYKISIFKTTTLSPLLNDCSLQNIKALNKFLKKFEFKI